MDGEGRGRMEDITIRKCAESDVHCVSSLEKQWVEADFTYGCVPSGERWFGSHLGPYFLLAEERGTVVGFIVASKHQVSEDTAIMPAGTEYVEIDSIYTTPSHRDMGIGGLLLEHICEQARRDGIRRAQVYSANKDIHRIMKFYERHGFRSWHIRMFRDL
jgi:GNAT superfamily N-acetyltransferase